MLQITAEDGTTQVVHPDQTGAGLIEARCYRLWISEGCTTVLVDDTPLRRLEDGSFDWQPSFYAGVVRVETLNASRLTLATYFLDVGPTETKLGAPLFKKMIEELQTYRSDLLLGTEAATRAIGHGGEYWNPEIGYARLRQHGESCIFALKAISESPLLKLKHERRSVLPHLARRIDLHTVRGLARSPSIAAIQGRSGTNSGSISTISTPATSDCVDNAANRAMAVLLDRLLYRASNLLETYHRASSTREEGDAAKFCRRVEVIRRIHASLKRIRQAPTFAAISRPDISAEGFNALSAHPAYAVVYKSVKNALSRGIEGTASDRVPISPTWELYERWCFVQTLRMLENLLPMATWTTSSTGSAIDSIRVRGVTDSLRIDLYLQARFRAWDVAKSTGFRSLSGERVPDITVTVTSASGRFLLVLDAKYRVSRSNVLDAMQSAHLYRDSLFWGDVRTWRSILLIPRTGGAPWLESQAFRSKYGVGCIEIGDSRQVEQLRQTLLEFMAQATHPEAPQPDT